MAAEASLIRISKSKAEKIVETCSTGESAPRGLVQGLDRQENSSADVEAYGDMRHWDGPEEGYPWPFSDEEQDAHRCHPCRSTMVRPQVNDGSTEQNSGCPSGDPGAFF